MICQKKNVKVKELTMNSQEVEEVYTFDL